MLTLLYERVLRLLMEAIFRRAATRVAARTEAYLSGHLLQVCVRHRSMIAENINARAHFLMLGGFRLLVCCILFDNNGNKSKNDVSKFANPS